MAGASSSFDSARRLELEIRDVEYLRDGADTLMARVYQPKGAGPFPAVIYIHGGAWTSNDRTTNPGLPRGVAERGVAVVAIDFRQGGEHPYPSSLVDINYATRWIKAHAADFNAVPGIVGGMGASSGGHLILLAAMRPGEPRYSALPSGGGVADNNAGIAFVISCFGVLDPYGRYLMAKQTGNAEMVARHDAYFGSDEAMQEGNPVAILRRKERATLPPVLFIQGMADQGVPKGMAEEFTALYSAAGGEIDVAMFDGMPHGIWDWPENEVTRAIDRIQGFIARQVGTAAAAS